MLINVVQCLASGNAAVSGAAAMWFKKYRICSSLQNRPAMQAEPQPEVTNEEQFLEEEEVRELCPRAILFCTVIILIDFIFFRMARTPFKSDFKIL